MGAYLYRELRIGRIPGNLVASPLQLQDTGDGQFCSAYPRLDLIFVQIDTTNHQKLIVNHPSDHMIKMYAEIFVDQNYQSKP